LWPGAAGGGGEAAGAADGWGAAGGEGGEAGACPKADCAAKSRAASQRADVIAGEAAPARRLPFTLTAGPR